MPLSLASYRSQNPSLHLVGWVPKVIPYLEQSRVLIAPLLSGAGTKRKIIQSLMIGTPVVTTSIGAEGLNLIHNDHALIADTSADFARAVTRLLTSDDLWQRLARQGREHIQQQHGSTNQQAIFDSFLRQLERP